MNLTRLVVLYVVFHLCTFCAAGQDSEISFKVVKKKTATLLPDTTHILNAGKTFTFTLHGGLIDADVDSIIFLMGEAKMRDSLITIKVSARPTPDVTVIPPGLSPPQPVSKPGIRFVTLKSRPDSAPSVYYDRSVTPLLDSSLLVIYFKKDGRSAQSILTQKFYIRYLQKISTLSVNKKTGFDIRWASGKINDISYHKGTYIRAVHNVHKDKLSENLEQPFTYQNFDASDTSIKNFDSLYAVVTVNKKVNRFHIKGSTASPEMMDAIRAMRLGDKLRVVLFCPARDNDKEQRKILLFKNSLFASNK